MELFFIERDAVSGDGVLITGQDAHHITKVLRMSRGAELLLSDGVGMTYKARIIRVGKGMVECEVEKREAIRAADHPRIVLGQAIPKGDKMALVVRKSTELGASALYPLHTLRSVLRPSPGSMAKREERWRRISIEASKQCRRFLLPEIHPARTIEAFLRDYRDADIGVILWEKESVKGLKALLDECSPIGPRGIVAVAVGPEGGFAEEEVDLAASLGFTPVSLGRRTLRTETVSLAVLSILQYELGDMGHP